jgi:hypothetical protein
LIRIKGLFISLLTTLMSGVILLPMSLTDNGWKLSKTAGLRDVASDSSSSAKPNPDLKASLRLTHLLYSAVLDRYMAEGLTTYRPDFLLNERYLRTFLYEWGQAIEKGSPKSSREIWTSISRRSSYLGVNFQIWMQMMPHIFSLKEEGINIGYRRETFLAAVLASESTMDFSGRSSAIVDFVSRDLMTEDADQELGLRILESFSVHGNADVRKEAIALIQRFPLFSKTVTGLRLMRDVALGYAAASNGVPSVMGKIFSVGGSIGHRLASAIRLPELVQAWRASSSLVKASATSVGAHAAGLSVLAKTANDQGKIEEAKKNSEASLQEFRGAFQEADANVQFLMALSMNTASERSPRLLTQQDFNVPSDETRSLARKDWIRQTESVLRDADFYPHLFVVI